MTSGETAWSFPPALNTTFREAFVAGYAQPNDSTEDRGVYAILLASVQNLTLQERLASGFRDQGWGGENATIRAGDTVSGTFTDGEFREYGLNCILCTKGIELGSIEQACANYTDADNIEYYTKKNGPVPSLYLDSFPSLDQYSSIPEDTCGLCIFTILNHGDSLVQEDYSVPFPVLQRASTQPKAFNASFPTGVAVPPRPSAESSIPTMAPQPQPQSQSQTPVQGREESKDTGLIVGVVVGVLFVASCIMGLIIFLWTRRQQKKVIIKPYSHSSLAPTANSVDQESQGVELQPVRSVMRRPDSSGDEVPPSYHEAVRAQETIPAAVY
ncbi:hypothetical protein BU23DRAFT_559344, partial [Bimuria novae-zelandiae CBS 107.79]